MDMRPHRNKYTYKKSGVDYDRIDPVKRLAQKLGLATKNNLNSSGFKEVSVSRGESAYVFEMVDCYLAIVEEGLGTKNLIADEMGKITGKSYYEAIAQDTVAMIINDLITVGAKPLTLMAYWAVGSSSWFNDHKRASDLVKGWKKACDLAGCSWGGGETPVLKDVLRPEVIDLAGCAIGQIKPKKRIILGDKLKQGDVIIFFESSGIHANGLTLARKLKNVKLFGEEVLKPTVIYSRLINDILDKDIDIHYMVNITGHGWRKLMRARKPSSYVIDNLPPVPKIFRFIQKQSQLSDSEMYATFNMGAGFALYVEPHESDRILGIAKKHKINAWVGGRVEKGERKVVIKSKNIVYYKDDLKIR